MIPRPRSLSMLVTSRYSRPTLSYWNVLPHVSLTSLLIRTFLPPIGSALILSPLQARSLYLSWINIYCTSLCSNLRSKHHVVCCHIFATCLSFLYLCSWTSATQTLCLYCSLPPPLLPRYLPYYIRLPVLVFVVHAICYRTCLVTYDYIELPLALILSSTVTISACYFTLNLSA